MKDDITVALGYLKGAQLILAIYGAPDGPTDPQECYENLTKFLEAPGLLEAQERLSAEYSPEVELQKLHA